jgi:hypothetical protein
MNDLEFEVAPGLCASELHDPEERQKRYLCVRLGSVTICGDCIDLYSSGMDDAVRAWRHQQRSEAASVQAQTPLAAGPSDGDDL